MTQFGLTCSQLEDVLLFIYNDVVEVNDIMQFLNNGESLEICGIKRADKTWAMKSDEENSLRHEIRDW